MIGPFTITVARNGAKEVYEVSTVEQALNTAVTLEHTVGGVTIFGPEARVWSFQQFLAEIGG